MKHKKRPDYPTLVFVFGCKRPVEGEDKALDQIRRAQQCQHYLMERKRDGQIGYESLLYSLSSELVHLKEQADETYRRLKAAEEVARQFRVTARSKRKVSPNAAEIRRLKQESKDAYKRVKDCRNQVKTTHKSVLDQFWKSHKSETKAVLDRNPWGLYSITKDDIKGDVIESKNIRFKSLRDRWKLIIRQNDISSRGGVYYTFQDILDGKWDKLRLTYVGQRRNGTKAVKKDYLARFLVNTNRKRQREYITIPVTIHRDIPPDAIIPRAALVRERRGCTVKWCLQLSAEHKSELTKRAAHSGVVAIDYNWRNVNGSLDVMTWVGDDGRHGRLILDKTYVDALAKVDDIKSIRDRHFNEAREAFCEWKKSAEVPAWISDQAEHAYAWRSPKKLVRLFRQWRDNRFDGDGDIFSLIGDWYIRECHLYRYQEGRRRRMQATRLDFYRNVAAKLRKNYGTVLLDGINLDKLAKTKNIEESDTSTKRGGWQRNTASLSIMTSVLKTSGMVAIKSQCAYTSRKCQHCAAIGDKSADTILTCQECGTTINRDVRACMNTLQAFLKKPVTLTGDLDVSSLISQGRSVRKLLQAA